MLSPNTRFYSKKYTLHIFIKKKSLFSKYSLFIFLLPFILYSCTFKHEFMLEDVKTITENELNEVEIAPLSEAITFARFLKNESIHIICVSNYSNGIVSGIDLTSALSENYNSDPIKLFLNIGYDSLVNIAKQNEYLISKPIDELILPVNLEGHHIAAGVNFPEHANETGVSDGPFLFPKIVKPTSAYSTVSTKKGLLDYEAEIAWVVLEPLNKFQIPEYMGLILCNDYTDRETLLHHIDPNNLESGEGFTTGKSFEGYLPVGNLFIIPKDYHSFTNNIELSLYVNKKLRQQSFVVRAVWQIDELLNQSWKRKDVKWSYNNKKVSLFMNDNNTVIQDGVMIMSGTPPGTVFNEINTEEKLSGAIDWLFLGWKKSVQEHAIDDYISDAKAAGIYLLPGDNVDVHVNKMGVIRNIITEY
jgi:2,4-diketo-3-deoxy-L-fuconate hydrolase